MRPLVLSEEQAILGDVAERFLRERYGFAQREAIRASASGVDQLMWRAFAEMGWLGLHFPASLGGSNGSMADVELLMERFGAALVVEPYISTVVAGGTALLNGGSLAQRQNLIPRICAGDLHIALAIAEPGTGYDHDAPATAALPDEGGYRLNGDKAVALDAPHADMLLVSAAALGTPIGGVSLFLVPAEAAGVTRRNYPTIDGRRASDIKFRDVRLEHAMLLGEHGAGLPILDRVVEACIVAFLGEATGVVQAAVDLTASYLNMREQFGRKLASFQALRHRVASMFILKEELRALCRQAAALVADAPGTAAAGEMVAAAKIHAGMRGRHVCEEAIQLHGAIGITDEYIIGHYLKRMVTIDHMFGNAPYHLDRFAKTARSLNDEVPRHRNAGGTV